MNDKMNSPDNGASDRTDAIGNTHITDFTRVVSRAAGQNRDEQRSKEIHEELVRECFGDAAVTPAAPPAATPSFCRRLLQLLKLN